MNKEEFLREMNNVKGITSNDLEDLVEASKNYPYCQNLHLLIAKSYHDIKHPKASAKLHTAAIYAPDRHLLKKIIEDDPEYISARTDFHKKYEETKSRKNLSEDLPVEENLQENVATETDTPSISSNYVAVAFPALITSTSFIDDRIKSISETVVSENIQNKTEFKQAENDDDKNIPIVSEKNIYDDLEKTIQEYKKRRNESDQPKDHKEESKISESPTGTDEPSIVTHEKENDTVPVTGNDLEVAVDEKAEKPEAIQVEEKEEEEELINEQNRIIENFIKLNPTLSRFDLKFDEDQPTVEDLSIPKLVIGEHLISENLAVILHKQGKIKKAIGIYEKLILKFPEKKAYFTSCIEKIKNTK